MKDFQMKKIVFAVLAVFTLTTLTACGGVNGFQSPIITTKKAERLAKLKADAKLRRKKKARDGVCRTLSGGGMGFPIRMSRRDTIKTQVAITKRNNAFLCLCVSPGDRPRGTICSSQLL